MEKTKREEVERRNKELAKCVKALRTDKARMTGELSSLSEAQEALLRRIELCENTQTRLGAYVTDLDAHTKQGREYSATIENTIASAISHSELLMKRETELKVLLKAREDALENGSFEIMNRLMSFRD
mmetsp:Transcript_11742/g.23905  ORF Transcript_11742/g.23905 Transcript_11742/m.23905 type:complete len:128 (-) Transcript_11742:168-551(-)